MSLSLLAFNQILHCVELSLKIIISIVNTFGAVLSILFINLIIFEFGLELFTYYNWITGKEVFYLAAWLMLSVILNKELSRTYPSFSFSDFPRLILEISLCSPFANIGALLCFLLSCP